MDNKKQKIHFIGIGGIGVSALARYFLACGDEVNGSDAAESEITQELEKIGAKIYIGHYKNLDSRLRGNDNFLDLVIYSAAVQDDNPELVQARQQGIKCQKYAEALGELTKEKFTIAVSGMHGKSTTTAMIGLILEAAGLDPTVIVGTKVKWNSQNPPPASPDSPRLRESEAGVSRGGQPSLKGGSDTKFSPPLEPAPHLMRGGARGDFGNFRMGQSKYLVIEADEYDRSILNYWPKILALLNIEEEHLDTYKDLDDIVKTFGEYSGHLPTDGVLIANEEDENVKKVANQAKGKVIYYSSSESASGRRVKKSNKKVLDSSLSRAQSRDSNNKILLNLKIPGKHNLSDAMAALAVARVLNIPDEISIMTLNNFSGTWRRMEFKGEVSGAKIYDDYAHHPTEIKATLEGVRELFFERIPRSGRSRELNLDPSTSSGNKAGKLWCVFQPHQYQRTYNLFDKFISAFESADRLILLPIYSVEGREDDEIKRQVSSKKLAEWIRQKEDGRELAKNVIYCDSFETAEKYLRENLKDGDVCIIMGAGDVYQLTNKLLI